MNYGQFVCFAEQKNDNFSGKLTQITVLKPKKGK